MTHIPNAVPISSFVDHVYRSSIMADNSTSISQALREIYDGVAAASDGTSTDNNQVSLFAYTKSTIISSRMFIEETLADEAILPDLTRNILNLYVGLIMTALGVDRVISSGRRVREVLELVGTESFKAPDFREQDIAEAMQDYFFPAGAKRYLSEAVIRSIMPSAMADDAVTNPDASTNTISADPTLTPTSQEEAKTVDYRERTLSSDGRTVSLNVNKESQLPTTAMIQLDLDTYSFTAAAVDKDNIKATFGKPKNDGKLNVMVQLRPRFIPTEVSRAFIDLNFAPTRWQRWIQVNTGEISFFSDFLLGCDLSKRYRKALLTDKTGVLKDMLDSQTNSVRRHFSKIGGNALERSIGRGGNRSANIANTILVIDRQSFDHACHASGIDFKRQSVRETFFAKTYAMLLAVVDGNFGRVTIYYNGISQPSEFTYRQLSTNAKSESMDLMSIMRNYAASQAPRF